MKGQLLDNKLKAGDHNSRDAKFIDSTGMVPQMSFGGNQTPSGRRQIPERSDDGPDHDLSPLKKHSKL